MAMARKTGDLTREQLEAHHAWESDDEIPRDPATTEFRRRVRLHQALWRERHGHPIGSQPIAPRPDQAARPVGSRLPLEYAKDTGANFVTSGARAAVRSRTSIVEPHQSLDHQRLWADLLWAPSLAFNLFGDLAEDLQLADRVVHELWPDAPGRVSAVRFSHSPGRLDPQWLNSLRAFDTAFVLDRPDGSRAIVGINAQYRDWLKPEIPKPRNEARNRAVAERSAAFAGEAVERYLRRGPHAVMWLEHLLLLSMLQHPSAGWTWGRYVVIHPAGNPNVAGGLERYREGLVDDSTFGTWTLEELFDRPLLPARSAMALRERYLLDG
jgi:PD-(D/E)XK nuclease superfamily protein